MHWQLTRDRKGYESGAYMVRKHHTGPTWRAWVLLVPGGLPLNSYSIAGTRQLLGSRFMSSTEAREACERHAEGSGVAA